MLDLPPTESSQGDLLLWIHMVSGQLTNKTQSTLNLSLHIFIFTGIYLIIVFILIMNLTQFYITSTRNLVLCVTYMHLKHTIHFISNKPLTGAGAKTMT